MDIQPTNQQAISDDQELAKVLAGVNQQAGDAVAAPSAPAVPEAPVPLPTPTNTAGSDAGDEPDDDAAAAASEPATPSYTPPSPAGDLDTIKQDALSELRPLVDKLDVSPEEKFDTYLLLLRSTDDKALIAPAHEAARSISDEARRAQALLDIIKEIDYLSNPPQSAA